VDPEGLPLDDTGNRLDGQAAPLSAARNVHCPASRRTLQGEGGSIGVDSGMTPGMTIDGTCQRLSSGVQLS
jgi:hypothetical protein